MKLDARTLLIALFLLAATAIGQSRVVKPIQIDKDTAELVKLTKEISFASVNKDAATLERLMDDNFVMLGASDRYYHKRELIGFWTKKTTDADVDESSVPTEIQVFLFGKTAVVTSLITDSVSAKSGKEVIRSRTFDVWSRSGKSWRWISSRETLISK